MIKKEFYFDSRDGVSKLHAVRWMPENTDRAVCVVQIVHGMAEYVERYQEFAEFLTDRGIVVTGEDHLGHGKSVGEDGRYGYFCEQDPATVLVRDVHRLKKITQEIYPDVPYVILGHSMGSFITRNYLCRYGAGIAGAVIMGTGMQSKALLNLSRAAAKLQHFLWGGEHVSHLIDRFAFGGSNRQVKQARTPFDWLSRDGERVERYISDPLCGFVFTVNGFCALFELISRLYDPRNLERVPKSLPVYMVSGTGDPVGGYGKGVRKAFDSLKGAGLENIELKLYEGGRHELLNETNRQEVMQDIYGWIERVILSQAEWRKNGYQTNEKVL